jgi:hypothetical protein
MASTHPSKPRAARGPARQGHRWSQHVTQTSNALDLEPGVFKKRSAKAIALSLKGSADRSRRRKVDSFRSAMSMLTFYVNRAGKGLSDERRRVLEGAKEQLRALYGRADTARPSRPSSPARRH